MRIIGAITLIIAMALLAGCNPQDAGNLKRDLRDTAGHAQEAAGNAKVAASVNTVLALRKGVDMSGLHIEAKEGVVTVGGHVRNAEEKQRVLKTVMDTRGVDKVIDQLRVQK